MKAISLTFVLSLLAAPVFAQTTTTPPPTQTPVTAAPTGSLLEWDDPDAQVTADALTYFSVCLDGAAGGNCATVNLSSKVPNTQSYAWPFPALKVGPHTATIAACNDGQCSTPAQFAFTVAIIPRVVTNLRIVSPVGGK